MSVQRYTADGYGAQQGEMMPDPEGPWMLAADHACIVAEAGAAVFAFHPEWTVTGMCDSDCLACRRLTELITEREKGYEEGKADAEQEHAAAWDRATFDSTAYEQGKRDAAEEARAAERRHWEARFRNAEQAHAAALAGLMDECAWLWNEVDRWIDKYYTDSAPRTLTADDPEPAVGSVVLFDGLPYIRQGNKWVAPRANIAYWYEFMRDERPTVLIHDGEATPQVKPCSTCGEPVAYLTARPGWAGGWLHHPARPLDGHPAAIDEEATP